ncbi:DnaJ domain-containing protein [Metaplanococcus flavidus]
MVTDEKSYYDILRIESTASANEIKKAYYKLIREFTNENHPEEFKEIRSAYEILSNEEEKKQYDKVLNMDISRIEAINQIYELIANEEYYEAEMAIKKEMVLAGKTNELIILLAKCEYNLGDYYEVLETLSRVTNPSTIEQEDVYAFSGFSNFHLENYTDAEAFGLKLIEIDPNSALYYRLLRNVYMNQGRFEKLLALLEKMMRVSTLKIEHFSLLIDVFMLQDTIQVPKAVIKKAKTELIKLGRSDNDRQNLVQLIVNDIESYDSNDVFTGFYDMCEVLTAYNVNNDYEIKTYVEEVLDRLPDKNSISAPQETRQTYENTPNNQHVVSSTENSGGGSLAIAIILGIILSIIATPFVGIPAAFIYYSYAKYIWIMIGVLFVIFMIFMSIVSSL